MLCASACSQAEAVIVLTDDQDQIDITKSSSTYYVSQADRIFSSNERVDVESANAWIRSLNTTKSFLLDTSTYIKWVTIENQSNLSRWMLRLGVTNIEDATVETYDSVSGQRLSKMKTGSFYLKEDGIPDLHHGVELTIPKGDSIKLLITVNNSFFSGPPVINIANPSAYHQAVTTNAFVVFISFGVIVGLSVTALIQCALLADKKYFWYSMYLLTYTLGMGVYHNIFSHFFGFAFYSVDYIYWFYLSIFCFLQFFSHFLELSKTHLRSHYFVNCLKALTMMALIISPWQSAAMPSISFIITSSIAIVSLYLISIYALIKREILARFLMIGITVQLMAYIHSFLHINGLYTMWEEVQVLAVACIAFDAVLFSIALADRIRLLEKSREELSLQSSTDELTGLYNRRGFDAKLNELLERKIELDIVFVDLDNLKYINDEKGHEEGDKLLIDVAAVIQHFFPQNFCCARLGGDEFVLLISRKSLNIDAQFKQINQKLSKTWGSMTAVSYGVSSCLSKERISDSLHEADMAMYKNKIDRKRSMYPKIIRPALQ